MWVNWNRPKNIFQTVSFCILEQKNERKPAHSLKNSSVFYAFTFCVFLIMACCVMK